MESSGRRIHKDGRRSRDDCRTAESIERAQDEGSLSEALSVPGNRSGRVRVDFGLENVQNHLGVIEEKF